MNARRVAVVASEILGVPRTGGPGTADSLLAVALGRHGHDVELFVAPGRDVSRLSADWRSRYDAAGVRVRPVPETAPVRPAFLGPAAHVYDALRENPPDVVVADDWRALPYAALRSREAGRALVDTAFVLYCHGPARVFAAAARKVPDTVDRFGEEVAQRACVELADAVVSPSAWLVDWLRQHRWPLPSSVAVIQNLWQSVAIGDHVARVETRDRIDRLAFFGQVREGKGVRVFLDSLRTLGPRVLHGVEVLFLGHSRQWTEDELRRQLAGVSESVRLEAELDGTAALRELSRPGTLAVMPSLLENSPYAVAECLERGIPFVAADVGGTPELVAEEDRARVLHPPTSAAFAAALAQALDSGVPPARPAQPPEDSLRLWLELMETVRPGSQEARETGESILWAGEGVTPDADLRDALVAAQAACGADVVTCAVRTPDGARRLFLGDPGPLGLIANHYGVTGVVRRALVVDAEAFDPPWVFFARLALGGARVVSIPDVLAADAGGAPRSDERLAVLEAFEDAGPEALQQLPQLAATLAAAAARSRSDGVPTRRAGRLLRLLRRGSA
jgi:glycosyltransferase involved in cell wall biosynthesis